MKIVSTLVSFVLAATILFHSLQLPFTYAYYYLDRSDFIERLCENKDKPEMQCNGKCQLKKVSENTSNDETEPFKIINLKEITLFIVKQTSYNFYNSASRYATLNNYSNLYCYAVSNSLDHPPQVAFSYFNM